MYQSANTEPGPLTPQQQEMLDDAVSGLSAEQKTLPSKYFYDEEGSRIFDEITELDEYYPTRTEAEIMRLHGREMADAIGECVLLVEYGSGSSVKTRILLDCVKDLAAYVPVDISGEYLQQIASDLKTDYPHIRVLPVAADFTQPFELPQTSSAPKRVVTYFPGSTIGNFARHDAARILQQMKDMCGTSGGVLVGVDLFKPSEVLLAAYNDSQGVTARFNMNMLRRLNRELGTGFDLRNFRHEAHFNEAESRIEMHLHSTCPQLVQLDGVRIQFDEDESILTEYSHKYTLESFAQLASEAGLKTQKVWTDPQELFSVQYLTPA